MRKLIIYILSAFFLFWCSFATNLKLWDFLQVYFEWVDYWLKWENISNWRENINVKYTNIQKWTSLYKSIQKWINLWIFPNIKMELPLEKPITQKAFSKIMWSMWDIKLQYNGTEEVDENWAYYAIKETVTNIATKQNFDNMLLDDIKWKLENEYIYWDEITNCNSLTWCLDQIQDKYTEYYTPQAAQELQNDLEWKFSWIWIYLQLTQNWDYIVAETIKWWPAEKAWLKAWDIIIQVDNHTITNQTTITDISWRVKGKEWTYTNLKIQRWNSTLSIKIKRAMISLPNIEYSVLKPWICYMDINLFNKDTLSQFEEWLWFFQKNQCTKYIFDLRDNPWWELDTVINMLNYFVEDWKTILELQYVNYIQDIIANDLVKKFNNKTVFLLANKSTASASEVFIGTMKDYIKNTILIWEKTYWKWTAQSVVEYNNWSILKYTVAKRYTWKTKTNIDWIWFTPNISLDNEWINNLLQKLQK